MSCVMKTKIVPRDDVKTMPSITALHGPKGVLGNQEIGGGLPFCIVEEVLRDDERDVLLGGRGCDSDPEEKGLQGPSDSGL